MQKEQDETEAFLWLNSISYANLDFLREAVRFVRHNECWRADVLRWGAMSRIELKSSSDSSVVYCQVGGEAQT